MRRRLVVALALIALASEAFAADYETPVLRGSSPYVAAPPRYTRWDGIYFGGHVGLNSSHVDFSRLQTSLITFAQQEIRLQQEVFPASGGGFGSVDSQGISGGAFFGYNWQWSDIILGADATYTYTALTADSPTRWFGRAAAADNIAVPVDLYGNASMKIIDYVSTRIRAGFVLDSVLPYATFGLVVGRADITKTVTVDAPGVARYARSTSDDNFIYGLSWGGGFDFLIWQNLFLRGEYEYIRFFEVAQIKAQMHTGRIGAGFKF